jgi:hypothetical protein
LVCHDREDDADHDADQCQEISDAKSHLYPPQSGRGRVKRRARARSEP